MKYIPMKIQIQKNIDLYQEKIECLEYTLSDINIILPYRIKYGPDDELYLIQKNKLIIETKLELNKHIKHEFELLLN